MAEVVLQMPLCRSRGLGPNHALYLKVSDGQMWKLTPSDYKGDLNKFRGGLKSWAYIRHMKAVTRTDEENNLYVHMVKDSDTESE